MTRNLFLLPLVLSERERGEKGGGAGAGEGGAGLQLFTAPQEAFAELKVTFQGPGARQDVYLDQWVLPAGERHCWRQDAQRCPGPKFPRLTEPIL